MTKIANHVHAEVVLSVKRCSSPVVARFYNDLALWVLAKQVFHQATADSSALILLKHMDVTHTQISKILIHVRVSSH